MANLPGAEETDVLVRAVKEVTLYGDGRNPPKLASVKRDYNNLGKCIS